MKNRIPRSCVRCPRNAYLHSKLCRACVASGWLWCYYGKHVVSCSAPCDVSRRGVRCVACRTHAQRVQYQKQVIQPPAGYISTAELAKLLHFERSWIQAQIRRGWMAGKVWKSSSNRRYYVAQMEQYPPMLAKGEVTQQ